MNLFLTVRLCANYAKAIVTVQQVGTHSCGFNGFKTERDVRFVAKHTDRLELLCGKYAYEIEFNPPPPQTYNFGRNKRSHPPEVDETEEGDEAKPSSKMLRLQNNCSDEEELDNRKEEKGCSSNGDDSIRTTSVADSSTKSERSNNDSDVSETWENVERGNLLIYTASSVQNQCKVITHHSRLFKIS